jgi:hypothetical protein
VVTVTGFEETSDIPTRPIHVCVFEGLNLGATININTFSVLTGVPDSENMFISAGDDEGEVHDFNAVDMFMRSVSRVLPRAFTVSGHGAFTHALGTMYGSEDVTIAFKAMSFDTVAKRVKKIGAATKRFGKDAVKMLDELEPHLEKYGGAMSMLPGPLGSAGLGMMAAGQMGRTMRRV